MVPLFLPTRPLLGGRYGIAVLTKRAVAEYWFLPLPVAEGREPRGAILLRYPTGFGGDGNAEAATHISVAATHLQVVKASEKYRSEAAAQLHVVLGSLNELPSPRVVLGDFNLRPEVAEPILAEHGFTPAVTGNTFPAREPRMRIDWIASDTLPFSSVEVPDVRSSDHRPIVADLVVGPGSASG
jgi:endonuclease/exonuclease/phosphatase family metal-dependent hydrolase